MITVVLVCAIHANSCMAANAERVHIISRDVTCAHVIPESIKIPHGYRPHLICIRKEDFPFQAKA